MMKTCLSPKWALRRGNEITVMAEKTPSVAYLGDNEQKNEMQSSLTNATGVNTSSGRAMNGSQSGRMVDFWDRDGSRNYKLSLVEISCWASKQLLLAQKRNLKGNVMCLMFADVITDFTHSTALFGWLGCCVTTKQGGVISPHCSEEFISIINYKKQSERLLKCLISKAINAKKEKKNTDCLCLSSHYTAANWSDRVHARQGLALINIVLKG